MGPFIPNRDENFPEKKRAIKWIDNDKEATQGPALVTSKSDDDLNRKDTVEPVQTHKRETQNLKPGIKAFKLDVNQLTGIQNFTEISPDPLKVPDYATDFNQSQIQQESKQIENEAHNQDLFHKKEILDDVGESEIEEISEV